MATASLFESPFLIHMADTVSTDEDRVPYIPGFLSFREGRAVNIETICMDATEFPIPNVPLVLFFYIPFNWEVMREVFCNVLTSFVVNPREIVLALYGESAELFNENLKMFKTVKFQCRELELHGDWWRFSKYHGFLITSPKEII